MTLPRLALRIRTPQRAITIPPSRASTPFFPSPLTRATATMTTTSASQEPPRKLKILMLHGYTQSGPLFHAKTRALEKSLLKAFPPSPTSGGISLHYPTAPLRLQPADIPGYDVDGASPDDSPDAYGWWRRKGDDEPYTYEGMEQGLATIAEVLKSEGPFDGVVGFSQGGAAAGMVASLLESGRREAFEQAQARGGMRYPDSFVQDSGFIEGVVHAPLKFAVSYSGFGASTNALYQAFYAPQIATPMCHFLGSVDTVVSEERSLRLVEACVQGRGREGGVQRVVYHPGGHFLPSSQKQYVAALVAFIREALAEAEGGGGGLGNGVQEESVEDMDVPF